MKVRRKKKAPRTTITRKEVIAIIRCFINWHQLVLTSEKKKEFIKKVLKMRAGGRLNVFEAIEKALRKLKIAVPEHNPPGLHNHVRKASRRPDDDEDDE